MATEDRKELIRKIVACEGNIKCHIEEVSKFGWDCADNLVILNQADVRNMLQKFENGEISAKQLEEWADFIECRDDIGFEEAKSDNLREIIHWLANPRLGYELNSDIISRIEKEYLLANLSQ